jgi:hypothetical protein
MIVINGNGRGVEVQGRSSEVIVKLTLAWEKNTEGGGGECV